MVDQRNEQNKSNAQGKGGNGENASKAGQSATPASQTSKPMGEQTTDRNKSQSEFGSGDEGGLNAARNMASSATDTVRDTVGTAREKASEALEGASEWAEDTYGRVSHWASDAYENQQGRFRDVRDRSSRSATKLRGGVQDYVSENPMVVGIVGLAAGLLIGALLPRTRRENEAFGEWADELRHQGVRYAREATQRGREYVEETFEGDDPRFSKHESEFKPDRESANRH